VGGVRDYRDLLAWERAMDLMVIAYATADERPRRAQFGLGDQIRRSAGSIPANIAEGNARPSRREYVRFLTIAIASLRELETHVEAGRRLGLITEVRASEMVAFGNETARFVSKLRYALSRELGRGKRE
jgi:four helix bundle protein